MKGNPVISVSLTSPEAVLKAVNEFEMLGREAFLAKYGFGKAREYFLLLNGRRYDSKAIVGVAYGVENGDLGALGASDFSGGEQTVRRTLESLGFTVVKGHFSPESPVALVLVENEVTIGGEYDFWADDTGVQYHFPNQYRNRIRPGVPFVYYRGVRRGGNKRGNAEYFGSGVIGDVWPDPKQPPDTPPGLRRWYCGVDDYSPFPNPVPAKYRGQPYEKIENPLGWRTGVRGISVEVFEQILSDARTTPQSISKQTLSVTTVQVHQSEPFELIAKRPRSLRQLQRKHTPQTSRRAKEIGDWAEELVFRWLRDTLQPSEQESVDWVAQRGETPGWDITYVSARGLLIAVEVKATTAARFASIEITGNEWNAAVSKGEEYALALVTGALSSQPRVALLWNPAAEVSRGVLATEPLTYRITWVDGR